jgi:hypothetical protein
MSTYFFFAQDEEIEAQLPRMLETLECFMKGFDDDGCCLEGYGYWKYGFSHYLIAASMLRDYTDGKIDLFADPKVHKVAKFQQNVAINKNECIPFSDCSFGFTPEAPMTHFLKGIYPDIEFPSIQMGGTCSDIRWLLWCNPEYAESEDLNFGDEELDSIVELVDSLLELEKIKASFTFGDKKKTICKTLPVKTEFETKSDKLKCAEQSVYTIDDTFTNLFKEFGLV